MARTRPRRSNKDFSDMMFNDEFEIQKNILSHMDMKSLGRLGGMNRGFRELTKPPLLNKLKESQKETFGRLQDIYRNVIIGRDRRNVGMAGYEVPLPQRGNYFMPKYRLEDGSEFGINPIAGAKFTFKQEQKGRAFDPDYNDGWRQQGYLHIAKERVRRKLHTIMAHPYTPGIENKFPTVSSLNMNWREEENPDPVSEEEEESDDDDIYSAGGMYPKPVIPEPKPV